MLATLILLTVLGLQLGVASPIVPIDDKPAARFTMSLVDNAEGRFKREHPTIGNANVEQEDVVLSKINDEKDFTAEKHYREKRETLNDGNNDGNDGDNDAGQNVFDREKLPHYTAWDLSKRRRRNVEKSYREKRETLNDGDNNANDGDIDVGQNVFDREKLPHYTAWDLSKRRRRSDEHHKISKRSPLTYPYDFYNYYYNKNGNGVRRADDEDEYDQLPHYSAWDLS